MATQDSDTASASSANRSSRALIIVIGCVILLALSAALLIRSGATRPTIPNAGKGSQTEQH